MADGFYVKKKKDSSGSSVAKHNWAWFVGCFVLLLISLTFVLPTTGLAGLGRNEIVFGKFGNKKITYSPDSYLYFASEQYIQQYMSMFTSGSGDDMTAFYRSLAFKAAYDDTVQRIGTQYFAEKSGLAVGDKEVDDYIYKQLLVDGKFAGDYWMSLSEAEKKSMRDRAELFALTEHVSNDYSDVNVSERDVDFINSKYKAFKDFNIAVFKGDDAAAKADEAFAKINDKKKVDFAKAAADGGSSVVKVGSVFNSSSQPSFLQNSYSGDAAKIFEAAANDESLMGRLFALEDGAFYGEVISINDNEKMIVQVIGDTAEADLEKNKDKIRAGIPDFFSAFADYVSSSSLLKDNYTDVYNKYFT